MDLMKTITERRNIRYFKSRMDRHGEEYRMYKLKFEQEVGAPDYLLVMKRFTALIEFKKPNGDLSPHQAKIISEMRWFHVPAEILWSEKDVDDFMDTYIAPRDPHSGDRIPEFSASTWQKMKSKIVRCKQTNLFKLDYSIPHTI